MTDLQLPFICTWALVGVITLALVRLTFNSRVHWGWWLVYAALGPLILVAFVVVVVAAWFQEYERRGA